MDISFFIENLHIYLFVSAVIGVLTIFIYIKLVYPFWNLQPVYHPYDIWWYFLKEPFIVYSKFKHIQTRYCDLFNIDFYEYTDLNESQINEAVNLLQCYYYPFETTLFMFNKETFSSYLIGHERISYISFYREKMLQSVLRDNPPIIGMITSQSYKMIHPYTNYHEIANGGDVETGPLTHYPNSLSVYYIDFICVNKHYSVKDISRKLLETHCYRQKKVQNEILVSIFRKDGELYSGIVPFIEFTMTGYLIPVSFSLGNSFPPNFLLTRIDNTNFYLLRDIFEHAVKMFSMFIHSDFSNLLVLIQKRILYVFVVKKMDDIYALYIFRDTRLQYESNGIEGSVIELCASIQKTTMTDLFMKGYYDSVQCICKEMPVFRFLRITNMAHNQMILDKNPFMKIPNMDSMGAYYAYNMILPKQFFAFDSFFV